MFHKRFLARGQAVASFYNLAMQTELPVPHFLARIEPDGLSFVATADQPLLESMELAGVAWPSSCRNGTCRTCIGQLASGTVRYEIEWPGLSLDEKNDRFVLPCVAFACTPLVLCLPA